MSRGRRCARPGCRAWAMRGREVCWAHRDRDDETAVALRRSGEEGSTEAAWSAGRTATAELVAREVVPERRREPLADEIEILHRLLRRVKDEAEDPSQLASSIPRIIDTLVRTVRTQRALSSGSDDRLVETMMQVLIDLGFGGDQ